MRFDLVTLFAEPTRQMAGVGVVGRAIERGQIQLHTWNPRDYTADVHRTVDDRPFGGGPGMVMKIEPLRDAITAARQANPGAPVVLMSPQGQRFDQSLAGEQVALDLGLILVCGRYEGVDERLIEAEVDAQWSIGDYVLSGGELAALVVVDAIGRLLPGVLGEPESAAQDSFGNGLLDWPHYTRSAGDDSATVPAVLRSGDHAAIARWRADQALLRTWRYRPDLLAKAPLDEKQQARLTELLAREQNASG